MTVLKNVLIYIGLVLAVIVGIAFSFIELRSLFAGDFTLLNNAFYGGFNYACRSIYFLSIVALSITVFIFHIKHKKMNLYLLVMAVSLFVGALFSLRFYDYFISLIFILITLILIVIISVSFFKKEPQNTDN